MFFFFFKPPCKTIYLMIPETFDEPDSEVLLLETCFTNINSETILSVWSFYTLRRKYMQRCEWAKTELSIAYHDKEWGMPVHDDRTLFEFLILEGAQAGLSWETILKKRDNYRKAFDNFEAEVVAKYNQHKVDTLLADAGIVRNKLKIAAAIQNANLFLEVRSEFGSFDKYIWQFIDGKPRKNYWHSLKNIPAQTAESHIISKELKRRGFKFVGSTICYAFMQAIGMVNDHTIDCFRYHQV